jgi:sensor histidine kinase YesM
MPSTQTGKHEMLKQILLWTVIIFAISLVSFSLVLVNTERIKYMYSLEGLAWELYVSFFVALIGIVHYRFYMNFFLKRRYGKYLLSCITLLGLLFTGYVLQHLFTTTHRNDFYKWLSYAPGTIFQSLVIFYVPFAIVYAAIQGIRRNRERRRELEFEQRKTAILLLKNKLEPHFLFNSLNTIYAIAQREQANNTIAGIDFLSVSLREKIAEDSAPADPTYSVSTRFNHTNYQPLLQLLYVWLGFNGFLLLIYFVAGLTSGVWRELNPIESLIYRPLILATIALTIVGHFYWLYKPLFMNGKYTKYFLLLPLFLASMILVDASVNSMADRLHLLGKKVEGFERCLEVAVWRVLVAGSICAWIYAAASHHKAQRKKREAIERLTRESELRLLQSQTDTAALFNALNSLRDNVDINEFPETTTAVNELIALFRYSADKADKETVAVAEEMQFIEQYLHLQKMRVQQSENLTIQSSFTWDNEPADLAPMLLLPYIENAFKYGISYEHPSEINIDVKVKKQSLECRITNTDHSQLKKHTSPGMGLAATAKRLELQYENKFRLEQKTVNGIYIVHLNVNLR